MELFLLQILRFSQVNCLKEYAEQHKRQYIALLGVCDDIVKSHAKETGGKGSYGCAAQECQHLIVPIPPCDGQHFKQHEYGKQNIETQTNIA